MSKEKELRELVLEYILMIGVPVAVIVALIYLFTLLGNNVLAPLVNSLTVYLDKYGRATAEGFTLITFTGFGLKFYDQTMRGLSKDFLERIEKLDLQICSLKGSVSYGEKDAFALKTEIGELKKKLDLSQSKIKLLRDENISHQTEIERLKDPDGLAKKEQANLQKQNDKSLKAIAESIRWGRN